MKSVFGFRVRLQNPKSGFPNRTQPQSLLNELRIEALSRIYQIAIAPAARKTYRIRWVFSQTSKKDDFGAVSELTTERSYASPLRQGLLVS